MTAYYKIYDAKARNVLVASFANKSAVQLYIEQFPNCYSVPVLVN